MYTFKVREGVTYSDGSSVSAEDMSYALNRMIERPNDIAMPRSGCIRGFMENAQAIDPTTLQVNLKDPSVGFLGCVASPWISIPPKFILEEIDSGDDPGREPELDEIIGTGPFILKDYQRGISFEVERNERYYDQPFPYLDGVRHVIVTDPSSRVAAFRTGNVCLATVKMAGVRQPFWPPKGVDLIILYRRYWMVTDQQVILLRRRIMEGKTQQASAATAGMSARSARRW